MTVTPTEDPAETGGRPSQQVRQRVEALRRETALLASQPTFETRRGTAKRHAKLRAKLAELADVELAAPTAAEPDADGAERANGD